MGEKSKGSRRAAGTLARQRVANSQLTRMIIAGRVEALKLSLCFFVMSEWYMFPNRRDDSPA